MKKWFLILAVLAVLVTLTAPSVSAQMAPTFSMNGTLVSADATAATLLVHVRTGSPNVLKFIGTDMTLKTGATTKFVRYTPTGCVPITFADLRPGDRLVITGVVQADKSLYAKHVTVKR